MKGELRWLVDILLEKEGFATREQGLSLSLFLYCCQSFFFLGAHLGVVAVFSLSLLQASGEHALCSLVARPSCFLLLLGLFIRKTEFQTHFLNTEICKSQK